MRIPMVGGKEGSYFRYSLVDLELSPTKLGPDLVWRRDTAVRATGDRRYGRPRQGFVIEITLCWG